MMLETSLTSGRYLSSFARSVVASDVGRGCWIEQGIFVVVPEKVRGGIAQKRRGPFAQDHFGDCRFCPD